MKEELWLDVTSNAVISTSEALKDGKPYRLVMQGTFNVWKDINSVGPHSGQPEPAPMWPTEGKTNNQVGLDPEFVFAWPPGSTPSKSAEPPPRRAGGIQISLDDGKTWAHPSCSGSYNAKAHKYFYQLTGQNHPLRIRFSDSPYSDNYGRVYIVVQGGLIPNP